MGRGAGRQLLSSLLHQRTHVGGLKSANRSNAVLLAALERGQSHLAAGFSVRWMSSTSVGKDVQAEIMAFNRGVPVERAVTPPSSWYTNREIFNLELEKIFERRWQAVGRIDQLQSPGHFFTGKVGRVRYVVCMDEQGTLRAFHNVCRHHAAAVASGSGCTISFVCPYHGWTYGLDGRLQKASRLGGIKNFTSRESGLTPLQVAKWGPFVLIKMPSKTDNAPEKELLGSVAKEYEIGKEWLGSAANTLTDSKIDTSLQYVATQEYTLNCNWKVFCDNYLDGGYHVPYAHADLASDLNLKTYNTTLSEKVSIQSCRSAKSNTGEGAERKGEMATFAFVYPNFMINRYGPWMDTNLVLPISESVCRVIFDYYLEPSYLHDGPFIKKNLERNDVVQQEDTILCEAVQDGLQSPAYDVGRYAPGVEYAMHHFHILLHEDLSGDSESLGGLDTEDLQHLLFRHPSLVQES